MQESTPIVDKPSNLLHVGLLLGSASIFLSALGASLTFPFLQAQRDLVGCDTLCYGSMQSVRSGLSLVGSVLAGRLSDKLGRSPVLWLGTLSSIISYCIALLGTSVETMWIALIPASLLNQNFGVLKALFADYQSDVSASESQRASALGRLGMSVGISFMVGPIIAATFLKDHSQAMTCAIFITIVSGCCLIALPIPKIEIKRKASSAANLDKFDSMDKSSSWFSSYLSFLSLPVAQTPGAKLLLLMRCGMGAAFHIFMTVWPISLKSRFSFGPTDHAYFMGWIGLCYALSQGFFAQYFIKFAGEDVTFVLALCMSVLGVGRVYALFTTSVVVVYVMMACVIIALGVVNTSISSACSQLAGADQVGGLFGIMEAVENLAGLCGPILGGILFRYDPRAPIIVVVAIYLSLLGLVLLFYNRHIVQHKFRQSSHSKESEVKAKFD